MQGLDEVTDEQRELLDVLREYNEAHAEMVACRKDCEYDAAYFCRRQIDAEREAGVVLFEKLDRYIDARITRLTGAC